MNQTSLRNLSPSNFAFVMATGAVSIILNKTGWFSLSLIFLIIGLIGYSVLTSLFIIRLFAIGKDVIQDMKDIQKMFKYLTFSAGSSSLGISLCLSGYNLGGLILGLIGVLSTILLTYTLFCALFFHNQAPIQAISPFWLLLAIASNSSGIVLTTLWENEILVSQMFLLLAFSFWTFGVFIYVIFMTLNIYRMIFFPFVGQEWIPAIGHVWEQLQFLPNRRRSMYNLK